MSRTLLASLAFFGSALASHAGFDYRIDLNTTNLDALPGALPGFKTGFFAREPMIHNPAALAFDARGRLFVGQGPQFRNPVEDTPGDSVLMLGDTDGDGSADRATVFAYGFNCVQSLAWKGGELWIANAPDLTVVRDLDGDDVADEYRLVYSGLGTLEHALHGLNWAPDGMLYLTKGDTPSLPSAPKPFRELGHVTSNDSYDQPARIFGPPHSKDNPYRKTYITPTDPHTEGGVLRCDSEGKNLEIFSRGNRNPFDIAFDDEFCWLGTDNDQDGGDKIFSPFYGAHFGHRHPWSFDWKGENHPPTAPPSGPFFHGSGSGVVYYSAPQFPESYRNVFFLGDWLRMCVYVYRPAWQGALMRCKEEILEELITPGPNSALLQPTGMAVGPDGALYVAGWGREYGAVWNASNTEQVNAGRVYRVWYEGNPLISEVDSRAAKRSKPYSEWTVEELLEDLNGYVRIWAVDAQEELVRRGNGVRKSVESGMLAPETTPAERTWLAWTLGRMEPEDPSIDAFFGGLLDRKDLPLDLTLQAQRILPYRLRRSGSAEELHDRITANLRGGDPRVRFEAVQALRQARQKDRVPEILAALEKEEDSVVYYALWGSLRDLLTLEEREALVADERGSVRFGALLGLMETGQIEGDRVLALSENDDDPRVLEWSAKWLANVGHGIEDASRAIDKLIDLNRRGINFELRTNLLKSLARMELSEGEWDRLYNDFYRGCKNGEIYVPEKSQEAALALRALAKNERALPILWQALADDWAPVRLGAISALAGLVSEKEDWVCPAGQVEIVAGAYLQSNDPKFRLEVLRLLGAADEETWKVEAARSRAVSLAKAAAQDPDPRVVLLVAPLAVRLGEDISAPRREVATVESSLEMLASADANRGRELFFQEGGIAACYRCHQVGAEGNEFAPNLTDAGARLDAGKIVRSILDPNAEITEGFRANLIELAGGDSLTGVVVAETDAVVALVQSDGERLEIDKEDIVERRGLETSIMPANMGELLTPQEVADIAGWLLGLKEKVRVD